MPVVDYLILTPLKEEFRYLREAWPRPLDEEKVGTIYFYRVCIATNRARRRS